MIFNSKINQRISEIGACQIKNNNNHQCHITCITCNKPYTLKFLTTYCIFSKKKMYGNGLLNFIRQY